MKNVHDHKNRRIDLFPKKQDDGTWSCFVKIDGSLMNQEPESGVTQGLSTARATMEEAQTKALDAAKTHINFAECLEGLDTRSDTDLSRPLPWTL